MTNDEWRMTKSRIPKDGSWLNLDDAALARQTCKVVQQLGRAKSEAAKEAICHRSDDVAGNRRLQIWANRAPRRQ